MRTTIGLVLAALAVSTAAPAFAQEWREHEWREHEWRQHEWREHHWRGEYAPPVVYAPRGAVYAAPPPVIYAPPRSYPW